MLRAKSLPEFLEQANTDGMRATMLLQADGALQGAAGKGITALHGQIMGVVSTAMWGEFDGAGTGDLDMILMGMDTGTLGVARLRTGHLVCVYAEDWVQLGSVRTRLLSLRSALEISLRSLEEG
ncbi:unnamed protein product [Ectocarpus sp. 6 AP-2014]